MQLEKVKEIENLCQLWEKEASDHYHQIDRLEKDKESLQKLQELNVHKAEMTTLLNCVKQLRHLLAKFQKEEMKARISGN